MGLFEIHVDLWQWILSQAIGVVAFGLLFVAFQQKSKPRQLMWQSVVNFLTMFASLLLLNWIAFGIASVAFLKNGTFALTSKNKASKSLRTFFFVLFTTLNVAVMVLTWVLVSFHIIDVFLLVGIVAVNWGKSFGNIHSLNIPAFSNSIFLTINAIMFRDAMGVLKGAVAIISIIVFYFKFFKKRQPKLST